MRIGLMCAGAAVGLLAACATVSDVVPIGNGNYELAGTAATVFSSGAGEKGALLKVANTYCAKRGKTMVLGKATSSNGHMGSFASLDGSSSNGKGGYGAMQGTYIHPSTTASADIIFHCE